MVIICSCSKLLLLGFILSFKLYILVMNSEENLLVESKDAFGSHILCWVASQVTGCGFKGEIKETCINVEGQKDGSFVLVTNEELGVLQFQNIKIVDTMLSTIVIGNKAMKHNLGISNLENNPVNLNVWWTWVHFVVPCLIDNILDFYLLLSPKY